MASIIQNGTDYLISATGPVVFLLGVVVAGYSLANGSRNGVVRGIYAIAGGIMIMGAKAVVSTISAWVN